MKKITSNVKKFGKLIALMVCFTQLQFCHTDKIIPAAQQLSINNIIPKPVEVNSTGDMFQITNATKVYVPPGFKDVLTIGTYLSEKLQVATGFDLPVTELNSVLPRGNICLLLINNDPQLDNEGYRLTVTDGFVLLEGTTAVGLFRGVQTIRQLLPPSIESSTVQNTNWSIPTGSITDYANYPWRGVMLDVARHFFPPENVKRLIDQMAYYKMNILHLHLSDDQGWRLEIKSWPNLTSIGGSTKVGGGPGGFYTQAEYTDIVNYASSRYITVVPEFDMPGHTNAALASYASLNCNNTATDLYTGTTVGFSALCVNKSLTYQFIEDVIGEVAALTPSPYIHIGGDEASALQRADYIQFINQVQDIVSSKGKQMIGWEDIALASVKKTTLAQHWHDGNKAKTATLSGAKIIMSPAQKAYLDMKYNSSTNIGASWAGYISVQSAYNWQIGNFISGIGKENIMGIEAPLWTETIVDASDIDYMIFPGLLGYSEIGWSPETSHDWNEYRTRLGTHGPRLTAMAINFFPSDEVDWSK